VVLLVRLVHRLPTDAAGAVLQPYRQVLNFLFPPIRQFEPGGAFELFVVRLARELVTFFLALFFGL